MCKYFTALIILSVHTFCFAQQSTTVIGAEASAMGNTSTCRRSVWSTFGNPAGLAFLDQTQFAFTYDALPSFPTFNRMAFAAAVPLGIGVGSIGVYKTGDDLYNEQMITTGYANQFGLAALGARINLVQYNVEGSGRKHFITTTIGGIAKLTPWFLVGAYVANVNQPELEAGQKIPTMLSCGLAVLPTSQCFITAEIEKDLDYEPTLKVGAEYEIYQKIKFRSGFNLFPRAAFAGIGFKTTRLTLDYGYSFLPDLGSRHQGSVLYPLRRK